MRDNFERDRADRDAAKSDWRRQLDSANNFMFWCLDQDIMRFVARFFGEALR